MNAQPKRKTRQQARPRRGFSLLELMIVVVITGVLAAIAIPTFTGYIHRSRTSEATHFLGVIKLRQEAYRAESGSYLVYGSNGGTEVRNPASMGTFVPDYAASGNRGHEMGFPNDNQWFNELGARPDGRVRFGYMWAAGAPADANANVGNATEYDLSPADHYFVAQARSDLDADNTDCTFEVTSFTRGVWFSPAKGWE